MSPRLIIRPPKKSAAVHSLFDVTALPHVPEGTFTVAVPMDTFMRMVEDMDESFLITHSWEKIRKRISFKNVWQSFHKKHIKMKQ